MDGINDGIGNFVFKANNILMSPYDYLQNEFLASIVAFLEGDLKRKN